MKYCPNCGEEANNGADVCLQCGKSFATANSNSSVNDNGSFGWGLLGFCIPIVGLILYLVWKDEKPLNAKAVGTGALIGFVLGFLGLLVI